MNRCSKFLFFFLLLLANIAFAQRILNDNNIDTFGVQDSIPKKGEITVTLSGKTSYKDYKVISHNRDTTYIDTTLTIQKEYKYNFLRKDLFELQEFHNQGLPLNSLAYSFSNTSALPDIGFSAKQFPYLEVEDIKYYEVPTTTSEILYRTGLQQGQVLDAMLTANFSKRFNLSIAYKGLRSLGAYRRSLVSNGNFRTTASYKTKNDKYQLRLHATSQDFFNQESGGLTDESLTNFINNDPDFENRGNLDVNLENADSYFTGVRFYLEHSYKLFGKKDTTSVKNFSNLKVGHVLNTETKEFFFNQSTTTEAIFGTSSSSDANSNRVESTITNNEVNLEFNSKYVLGKLKAKANLISYEYGYDTILNSNSAISKSKLQGTAVGIGAAWNAKIKNFQLNASADLIPGSARLSGNFIKGEAVYEKDSVFRVKGNLLLSSKSPNFNTLLHQSEYDIYNWQNSYNNVNTRDLAFTIQSKWINGSINATNIDNYTYFDENNLPQQFENQVVYLKAKVNREFKFWKFALDNTIMYQNVSAGSEVFRVPELVTRNTLYYMDNWFKGDPMLVQIGATFKYFTEYNMNAYNPLLGEFTLQNETLIGFPTIDVFFNARVRRTRIYFKIDNVTSGFTEKNYFSAPNYPFRDFTIRFGLVWNWFI